ncbi:hypothetical protein WN943_003888 [Citrus x changshan-huyou]
MQWLLASENEWKQELGELNAVTPPCRVSIGDHVAPTFQKIYDRLSKIEEKVQKIDVLEAKLDNITKDLWRTTKLLEKFLASSNVGKDSFIDQPPAHDHQTTGVAHVDANKTGVELESKKNGLGVVDRDIKLQGSHVNQEVSEVSLFGRRGANDEDEKVCPPGSFRNSSEIFWHQLGKSQSLKPGQA